MNLNIKKFTVLPNHEEYRLKDNFCQTDLKTDAVL
jgi:hypothetical protein